MAGRTGMLFMGLVAALAMNFGQAQLLQQCLCPDVDKCADTVLDAYTPCGKQCSSFVTVLGVNYKNASRCLLDLTDELEETVHCIRLNLSDACAVNTSVATKLPRRFPETLELTAYTDLSSWLVRKGVAPTVRNLFFRFRQFFKCTDKCVGRKSGHCAEKAHCALKLPSDSALIELAVDCGKASGFTEEKVIQLCNCLSQAGIAKLDKVCPKL